MAGRAKIISTSPWGGQSGILQGGGARKGLCGRDGIREMAARQTPKGGGRWVDGEFPKRVSPVLMKELAEKPKGLPGGGLNRPGSGGYGSGGL